MAKVKVKEEELKENPEISKNMLGSMLNGYTDTHFNHIKRTAKKIPSGSLILDTYINVKSGTTIRLGGPPEAGKTSQAFLFAKNYMEVLPKSKTFYVNAEFKLSDELQERTGLKFTHSNEDWDYGTVFVLRSNVFDTICDMLVSMFKTMYENGEHLCVIIDSVDMLTLKSTLEKGISEGKKPAGVNYLTKELFRRIGGFVENYNGLLMMITQYSATFQLDPYSKAPPQMMEGNQTNALNHQASYGLYYRPRFQGDYILTKEKEKPDPIDNPILGVNAKIDLKKTSTDESGITVEVPIKRGRKGNAIWTEKELVDLFFIWDLAKKNNAWIEIGDVLQKMAAEDKLELKVKHNGMNQLFNYLEENPNVCKWLVEKFKVLNG